ncbi:hypothetical protein [Shimia gijangensis]|uniref:hypothetical protein n=1 Tax=Shimia gijangensis TaxID=1470563 RepID=UPI001114A2DE|nr:hypothetical protein [Shimia gijangensis]
MILDKENWWARLGLIATPEDKAEIAQVISNFHAAQNDRQGVSLHEMERKVKREISAEKQGDEPSDPDVIRQMVLQNIPTLKDFQDLIRKERKLINAEQPGELTVRGEEPTFAYIRKVLAVLNRNGLEVDKSNRWDENSEPTEQELFFQRFFFPRHGTSVEDRKVIHHALKKAEK